MPDGAIRVQACGCVALPEGVAAASGMLPGATLSVESDLEKQTVTLRVLEGPPLSGFVPSAACPVSE